MKRIGFGIVLLSLCCLPVRAQFSFDTILNRRPILKKVSANPSRYRLQIIYTRVSRKGDKPVFTEYHYRVDNPDYFYCASLVKLPVSILALRKLNEIGVDGDAIMFTDSTISCHRKVTRDPTSATKYPSV